MIFSDKLNFLMNLTQTANKDLAAGISVDRSLISLLRTGKRGMPRNRDHISHMALFFAQRCTADFQRHALSEMLGQTILRSSMPTNVLAKYLEKWLINDSRTAEHLFDGINAAPESPEIKKEIPDTNSISVNITETAFFYDNKGKRNAVCQILELLKDIDQPCTIFFSSDDYMEWLFEDYDFTMQLQNSLIEIVQKGFEVFQIMPSVNHMNRYVESLIYWLPLYVTGQVKAYYYPRIRDNLYRHFTVIVPGHCVLTSTSIGNESNSITMFSRDPELINENVKQYQQHLALCRSAMHVHYEPEEFSQCLQELFSGTGAFVQKDYPLSVDTLPADLLMQVIEHTENQAWKRSFQMFLDKIPQFEELLTHTAFVDISELSTAEEIRSGQIPIGCAFRAYEGHPTYTPETYIRHLKNILRLMDEYENYHFIPMPHKTRRDYSLFISSSGYALLLRNHPPALMLEIKRPEMVSAFREYLMRMAEHMGYDGIQRTKTRMQINALIHELQE